jgi:tRNA threonylcarbamoyladenosine biosynthesis protein TsaB
MKLLALDCSTDLCSVALFIDSAIIQQQQLHVRQHNKTILTLIKNVLAEGEISLNQLDALAFCCGPGSFTGIRLAASIVQGFALATDLPVIPVSTLITLAQGAYRQFAAEYVLTCLDARMQEVYWAACGLSDQGVMKFLTPEQLILPAQINLSLQYPWSGVGDGWLVYADELHTALKGFSVQIKLNCYPEARDAVVLACNEYLLGNLHPAESALPVYLRTMKYKKVT